MLEQYTESLICLAVKPGMVCVDVGANIGDASELMRAIIGDTGSIIAIEPMPKFRKVLKQRLPGIEIHPYAIKDNNPYYDQKPQWYVLECPGNEGDAGITDDSRGVPVEFRTLDQIIGGRKVDFIKIDVEGMELEVIRSGIGTISKHRPVILFETLYGFQEVRHEPLFQKIFDELYWHGYKCFSLVDGQLVPADLEKLGQDTLAIAEPRQAGHSFRQAFTIVFNGDFTLEQCVRNAMPVLDRYVVVEGATEQLQHIAQDRNGRSTDRTNAILDKLCEEFPDKLVVIRSKWYDKLEMCNAALKHIEPGLLWQLDCDEFYHVDAILRMMEFMDANPQYTDAEFWAYHFFGGFTHHTPIEAERWGNTPPWRRLFRWNGEPWKSHTPPRLDRGEHVLTRDDTIKLSVELYHYGYCWYRQVLEKALYHNNEFQHKQLLEFDAVCSGGRPIKPLIPFTGEHPVNVKEFVC